jgi:hypothetical protein
MTGSAGTAASVAAREFASEYDLRCDGFGDERSDGAGPPLDGELSGLLTDPRPTDPAWWCEVARCWRAGKYRALARACAYRGRQLVEDGAVADWALLQALAALLAELVPDEPTPEEPTVPWRLSHESSGDKQNRVQVLFGLGDVEAVKQRAAALAEAESAEALILSLPPAYVPEWATAARLWHRSGHYRLVIEQLFAWVADRPLSDWLPAFKEVLAWCGWSFHRIGDRPTACACFQLSVALDEPKAVDPADENATEPDEERPPGPSLDAHEYLEQFGRDISETDPGNDPPLFVQFARLASWLEERGLQGYLWRLAAPRDGMRSAALALTMQDVGRRTGWFLPLPPALAPIAAPGQARGHVPGLPPRPLAGRGADSAAVSWAPPSRLAAPIRRSAPAAQVPIGAADGRGVAELEIRLGEPTLLVGVPGAAAVLEAVASHLVADGWRVLLVSQGHRNGAALAPGWHRLEPAERMTDQSEFWLSELTGVAPLRRAITDCLLTQFAAGRDADATACVAAAIASLGPGSDAQETLLRGSGQKLREHAVAIVDEAVRLRFHGPRDLRRAARLTGLVEAVLLALRALAWTGWSGGDADTEGAGVYAALEANGFAAALLATLAVGSLRHTTELCAKSPEAVPVPGGFTFVLRERPSITEDELDELKALRPSQPPPPRARPPGDQVSRPDLLLPGNPWVEKKLITEASGYRLCVLVCGSFGAALEPVTALLKPSWPTRDVGLVTAITSPSEADMPAARDYATILAGDLPPDLWPALRIAAGVRLPAGLTDGLGSHGAVRVQTTVAEQPERLVVWPAADGRR